MQFYASCKIPIEFIGSSWKTSVTLKLYDMDMKEVIIYYSVLFIQRSLS